MDEAAERKERLRALRAAAELAQEERAGAGGDEEMNEDEEVPHETEPEATIEEEEEEEEDEIAQELKFRNYLPRDTHLQQSKVAPPQLPKFEDPMLAVTPAQVVPAEDPITSIAPKKPNWDLRRDVAKRLEKLERRTQRAMIELMQEEEKRRQEAAELNGGGESVEEE